MDTNKISSIIDVVVINNPIPENEPRKEVETNLFKNSILTNSIQLNRIPSTFQIEQSWIRWKRERGLEQGLEINLNTTSLFGEIND